jgi:hypothetical protein
MPTTNQFLIYTTPAGEVKIEVYFDPDKETIWATQKQIASLFNVGVPAISKHLSNIFESGELQEKEVVSILENTTTHGAIKDKTQTNKVTFYNLDAILSVGYRVNSKEATQFRIWANQTLKEYIIKGFAVDDDRLKNGQNFGKDYFKELLERVRSIRASERRIWQQITDIFAECSVDYNQKSEEIEKQKQDFYATIQNKFHFAITGQTAAEIIYAKADSKTQNMGLTTWKNSPKGRILKSDTKIAKNYLTEREIKSLERSVAGFFDYIEGLIERENTFTMAEFRESVDAFLSFNKYKILDYKGKVSHSQAIQKAESEYDVFNKTQKIESDFDKLTSKMSLYQAPTNS